jgi:anthranilate synthase component 2
MRPRQSEVIMIILIDNYDSFSYNLYQLIGSINPDIKVIRNDELSAGEIGALKPSHIVFSPGPGRPEDAGVLEDAVRYFSGRVPLFGVCLGHQGICEVMGARITYAKTLMHGKSSSITLDTGSVLFAGMPAVIQGGRYHSLAADAATIPGTLLVTARTADGEVMAVQHRDHPVYGVQFHPESILTPNGKRILENFLKVESKG